MIQIDHGPGADPNAGFAKIGVVACPRCDTTVYLWIGFEQRSGYFIACVCRRQTAYYPTVEEAADDWNDGEFVVAAIAQRLEGKQQGTRTHLYYTLP